MITGTTSADNVAGDIMGQSVMPRLVGAMNQFVRKGGGFWYCDNHKSFSFLLKKRSFEAVLPLEVVPFRAYHDGAGHPHHRPPKKAGSGSPR